MADALRLWIATDVARARGLAQSIVDATAGEWEPQPGSIAYLASEIVALLTRGPDREGERD